MKAAEKITKNLPKVTATEAVLLALGAVFLAALFVQAYGVAGGDAYTVVTDRAEDPSSDSWAFAVDLPPVDVNTADVDELESLDGVGPALAQRIIDYRKENGPFRSVEDLLAVKGIGEATLEGFRDDITVGGEEDREENENVEDAA